MYINVVLAVDHNVIGFIGLFLLWVCGLVIFSLQGYLFYIAMHAMALCMITCTPALTLLRKILSLNTMVSSRAFVEAAST